MHRISRNRIHDQVQQPVAGEFLFQAATGSNYFLKQSSQLHRLSALQASFPGIPVEYKPA